jgi:hypothetical protein
MLETQRMLLLRDFGIFDGMFPIAERFMQLYHSLIRQFWCGSKKGECKAHWVLWAWAEMIKTQHLGVLGFRDIKNVNLCLLARESWRILQEPNSLSPQLLKAIYF